MGCVRIERTVNAPTEHVWMMWTTLRCYRNDTDATVYDSRCGYGCPPWQPPEDLHGDEAARPGHDHVIHG